MKLQCGNSAQGQSVTLTGGWVLAGGPREMRLAGAPSELQVTETGLLWLLMYQLAILSLPGLKTSIFSEESPLKGLMKSWTHSLKLFEILPPSFGICLLPKFRSKIPNAPSYLFVWDQDSKYLRGFVSCVAQQSWPTAPLWMAIDREKAWTVFSCRMAVLALPAEVPAKVLLLAFCCQPDLPSGLSLTADISSLVSMSFVHQSSSQCCFMMCCKTTMLPWVCSAWLPHLSLLSLHTGPSSITASSELSQNLVCSAATAWSRVNTH